MKRNYPDKFVVSNGSSRYEWGVKREGDEYRWITTLDDLDIGTYNAAYMDKLPDTYKFIFPEPELVFPFEILSSKTPYTVTQGSIAEYVTLSTGHSHFTNHVTKEKCKEFIKQGIWIVTSVGEQKPVEAPVEVSNDTLTLTLKCDTTQPVEAMNALAEAAERVNMALLAMQDIMAGMGLTNV